MERNKDLIFNVLMAVIFACLVSYLVYEKKTCPQNKYSMEFGCRSEIEK